ncbi:MAG TPA: TonB-dependent receptor plug domain-containing protein, partial [Pirellulales bacterium]|nr:TonB-dependent receptor plug domain-containing protein [Pirellulales bacterium]
MATGPLRACALVVLLVVGSRIAAAQSAALDDPPNSQAEIAQAEDPPATNTALAQPGEQAPPAQPLTEIPETTVVGQPAGSGAQGNALPGNTVVTTPTRTGTALGEIGSSISVVTAEQIAQRQITTLTDALRELPGVNVVQTGGYGGTTSVFIRGATSEQTKVLLDGIWMNDPSSPGRGFDFSQMSIDNIERIEVIRGPQSSLYGSDAIGGVINIITKRGSGKAQARAGIAEGTLHTQRQWANITGGSQLFNYSLGGSYFGTQNISQADSQLPGNSATNPFSLGNLSSRIGFTPFENLSIDFIVRYNH